jgi:hypothetical protein
MPKAVKNPEAKLPLLWDLPLIACIFVLWERREEDMHIVKEKEDM